MSWATAEDVQTLTGKVVQDSDIQQAEGAIALLSAIGRAALLDSTILSTRNLDWLRMASAYQTAWLVEQPDYFSRMDVSQMTQDGTSATLKADALVLAPLARRCLKRLSWRGVRTLTPSINRTVDRSGSRYSNSPDLPGTDQAVYTSSAYDDDLPYKPL
jgi:hypothetical protein